MKKKIFVISLLIVLGFQFKTIAQTGVTNRFERDGDNVYVTLQMQMSQFSAAPNQTLVLTPIVQSGEDVIALPDIVLLGGNATTIIPALSETILPEYIYVTQNMQNRADFTYQVDFPFEAWMSTASLKLLRNLYDVSGTLSYTYSNPVLSAIATRTNNPVQTNNIPDVAYNSGNTMQQSYPGGAAMAARQDNSSRPVPVERVEIVEEGYTEDGFRKVDTPNISYDSGIPVQLNTTPVQTSTAPTYTTPTQVAVPTTNTPVLSAPQSTYPASVPVQQTPAYTSLPTTQAYNTSQSTTYTEDGYRKVETPDFNYDTGVPIQLNTVPVQTSSTPTVATPVRTPVTSSSAGYPVASIQQSGVPTSVHLRDAATYTSVPATQGYNTPQPTAYTEDGYRKVDTPDFNYDSGVPVQLNSTPNQQGLDQPVYKPLAMASSSASTKAESYRFYFPNKESYRVTDASSNNPMMESLVSRLREIQSSNNIRLAGIQIIAGTSIDGLFADNERLTQSQALEFKALLQSRISLPESLFQVQAIGEDWTELANRIQNDPNMPNKQEALSIIQNTDVLNGRESQLMLLANGAPYKYITANLLNSSRKLECIITYNVN